MSPTHLARVFRSTIYYVQVSFSSVNQCSHSPLSLLHTRVAKPNTPCLPRTFSAVHPKTGRVCVPINPAEVRDFDPFTVPTLGQLQRQIDQYDKDHGDEVNNGYDREKNIANSLVWKIGSV